MKKYLENLFFMILFSYTAVSVGGVIANMIAGTQINNFNVLLMFILCVIASFVLSLSGLFENISPLVMMIIQYLVALGLGAVVIYIVSFFEPIAPGGWFDLFRSFTIPYIILAAIYYISVFVDTRKKDAQIKELQKSAK